MQNKIKLSVVVPVYNVEKYLADCLESIFNQDLNPEDFEVILVNDGSTDSSLSICESYQSNHRNIKIVNQKNQGLSIARNVGIENAIGKYLYFIDSDDFLTKKCFNQILAIMEEKDLDFFGFGLYRSSIRDVEKPLVESKLELNFRGTGLEIVMDFNFNNGVWWYVFKRNLVDDLKFIEGRFCEDGLFTPRLLLKVNKALISSEKIYCYYINELSIVKNKNVAKNLKLIDDMFFAVANFDEMLSLVPANNHKAFKSLRRRQETYVYYGIIRFLKANRSTKELFNRLNQLNFKSYKAYPMKAFTGYNKKDEFLIFIFNHKWMLAALNEINKVFKIIK